MIECKDATLSTWGTHSIRFEISSGVGNEIQEAGSGGADSESSEGADTGDMQDIVDTNNKGARKQRPRASFSGDTTTSVGEQSGAIYKREDIEEATAREQATVEGILGATFMGEGIFCGELRDGDRRNDNGILGATRRRRGKAGGRFYGYRVLSGSFSFRNTTSNLPPSGGSS